MGAAGGTPVATAVRLADLLDSVNRAVGSAARWLALSMVLLQFAVVLLRYAFGVSHVFLGEGVLYMHAALFMLGSGYTLLVGGHVRVDILYARFSGRRRLLVDLLGAHVFLLPSMLALLWFSWPMVRNSWEAWEGAISVGGIPALFILKSLVPAFCALMALQGCACILRDIARLRQLPRG